jgi:DNA-binding NtrC family response regulator
MDRILVAEDNEALRIGIRFALEECGYAVQEASSGEEAVRFLEESSFHAVVSDIRLGDLTGIDILKKAKEVDSDIEVILMTAYATVETAVQALRLGAFDYIQKPFDIDLLKHRIETALRVRHLRDELSIYRSAESRRVTEQASIVAEGKGMKDLLSMARKIAPTTATVLITGETGTGKEVLATYVHYLSLRASGPFVKVNCAALHENLLESELFGHEKGAFTGADRVRIGRFEQADKGTLFLDEIGDMSVTTQAKVLRVLQDQCFERLGSNGRTIRTDVRVMAATNKDLPAEVREGRFRQDLFFRLNVVNLRVPPLRERREDILPLARFFLDRFALEFRKGVTGFSPEAIDRLRGHLWPGNVRELQNVVERAVLLSEEEKIGEGLVLTDSAEERHESAPVSLGDTLDLERLETTAIREALRISRGVQKEAAALLGISPRVLNYKIQSLGIDWKTFRN